MEFQNGRMYARPRPSTALGSMPSAEHFMTQLRTLAGVHWLSLGVVLYALTAIWNMRSGLMCDGITADIRDQLASRMSRKPFFSGAAASAAFAMDPIPTSFP